MGRFRFDYFLPGLLSAVGLASLLGATGHSWAVAATLTALSLTDVLLAAAGLLVAAMVGVAGVLVIADARADVAAAHAWQDINAELAVVGTIAETAPVVHFDARYIASPQDEGLRRIFLAHRFDVLVPSLSGSTSAAQPRADAVAAGEIDGARSDTDLLTTDQRPAADREPERIAERPNAAFDCPPLSIAGNVKDYRRRGQGSAKRRVSKALLVANAGVWWQYPNHPLGDAHRATVDVRTADVIVLANRSGRNGDPDHRGDQSQPSVAAPPGCRGPPVDAGQRQVSSETGPIGKSFREKDQSRANAPTDPAVVDDLGDRVPVGAAELQVVETYLDREFSKLLAAVASGADPGKS